MKFKIGDTACLGGDLHEGKKYPVAYGKVTRVDGQKIWVNGVPCSSLHCWHPSKAERELIENGEFIVLKPLLPPG
jgi:cytosine/adenosine deaminase-related metal-dependent hydrolase